MYREIAVSTENVIPLGHTHSATSRAEGVFRRIREHIAVIRLNQRTVVDADVVDGLNVFPVERFLDSSAVVDEHNSNTTAKKAAPFQARCNRFVNVEFLACFPEEVLDLLIVQALELESVLDCLLCGGINDFREQAVAFIEHRQYIVADHRLGLEVVVLARIFRCSVLVQHIYIAVRTV